MKLLRIGEKGKEKPAILDKNNKIRDLSSHISDLNPEYLNFETIAKIKKIDLEKLPELSNAQRLGSCINKPGKLIAIASLNNERREKFGNKYNIENQFRFNTYDQLLNTNDLDAVYISTPHTLHAELSIKAAGKGKHILCEKPGAVNLIEGQKVINAAVSYTHLTLPTKA